MNKIKILMPAAEIAPLVKVGGLADVAGSLAPALNKLGCDVRMIMPFYGSIDRTKLSASEVFVRIPVLSNGKTEMINIWRAKVNGLIIYLVENKKYFSSKEVYAGNNSRRFLFFSQAVLSALPILKFKPDVIHCHDFHTALIPSLLKLSEYSYFKDIKTLYTIHNLNYQGRSNPEILKFANLDENALPSFKKDAEDGDINFMAEGIINSDLVNTVSPTYAKEIASSIYGAGLEKIIKNNKGKISGIINGLDLKFFNPKTDKFIKNKFGLNTLGNKLKNKLALQKKIGLEQNTDIALVGLISRLDWQKGLELINHKLIDLPCQFVFLGSGQKKYENLLKNFEKKYLKKVSANIGFDAKLAQQIYAGSDIFLMPSRFEPCGLGQMIAMRYGTVPVVRSTGGLTDTVDKKVGFSFKKFTSDDLYKSLKAALKIYYENKSEWRKLQSNCMKKDFSWNKSAKDYLNLYNKLIKK